MVVLDGKAKWISMKMIMVKWNSILILIRISGHGKLVCDTLKGDSSYHDDSLPTLEEAVVVVAADILHDSLAPFNTDSPSA
jgi:hypothetical protein